MAQWPLPNYGVKQAIANRSTSGITAVNVTASATPHTKGAYTTIIATTGSTPGYGILLWMNTVSAAGTDTSTLLDISIGSAGNEAVVIPNLMIGYRIVSRAMQYIPMYIPPNSRVACRIQSAVISKVVPVGIDVLSGEPASGLSSPAKFTPYGTNLATSGSSAVITPNASIDTMGAYSEITPSTTAPIHELLVQLSGSTGTFTASSGYQFEFAVGAGGSETKIFGSYCMTTNGANSNIDLYSPMYTPISFNIPVGTRLSARCSAHVASSVAMQVALTGITY